MCVYAVFMCTHVLLKNVRMYRHTYVHTYVYKYVRTYTYVHMYICVYVHMLVFYVCVDIYEMYTRVHIHTICTCVYMCVCLLSDCQYRRTFSITNSSITNFVM